MPERAFVGGIDDEGFGGGHWTSGLMLRLNQGDRTLTPGPALLNTGAATLNMGASSPAKHPLVYSGVKSHFPGLIISSDFLLELSLKVIHCIK